MTGAMGRIWRWPVRTVVFVGGTILTTKPADNTSECTDAYLQFTVNLTKAIRLHQLEHGNPKGSQHAGKKKRLPGL
jgi:hypothetical protein